MKAQRETDLVRTLLEYLHLRGIWAWRVNTAGLRRRDKKGREFFTKAPLVGVSDIMGVVNGGRLLVVEGKMPGGKLSPAQEAFLANVRERGGVAICAYSVADVERGLREAGV